MPKFSEEDKKVLENYVTDTEGDIFCVKGLQGIVGAAFARYSRAKGGFRHTLLNEFIKEGVLNPLKAEKLLQRILISFGDDSVGELEGCHLALENISMVATKEWEDRRIGGSPIEQSTRYVEYDQFDYDESPNGQYHYYRDPAVMASPVGSAYVETMDFIFKTYCDLIAPMKAYYAQIKPMKTDATYDIDGDGVKERWTECKDAKLQAAFRITYDADMRTKACDSLRALLPLSTKTNVGIFGNGRFFQGALSHCYSSDIPEVCDIAERAHAQLNKVIPMYVERAKRNDYTMATRNAMTELAAKLFNGAVPVNVSPVQPILRNNDDMAWTIETNQRLAGRDGFDMADELRKVIDEEDDLLLVSMMLYPYSDLPLLQIRENIRCDKSACRQIIDTYIGDRKSRRDRPGRAFECGYPYTFDMLTDFGTFKDLERHRMMTQQRQTFTPVLGFDTPQDLVSAGFEGRVLACAEKAQGLYRKLMSAGLTAQASYATLHGSLVRWTCGMNARELMHMIELRTGPQGHASYRKVCQRMHLLVSQRSPDIGKAIAFADHNEYFWARGDSEARQRAKEAALDAASPQNTEEESEE